MLLVLFYNTCYAFNSTLSYLARADTSSKNVYEFLIDINICNNSKFCLFLLEQLFKKLKAVMCSTKLYCFLVKYIKF